MAHTYNGNIILLPEDFAPIENVPRKILFPDHAMRQDGAFSRCASRDPADSDSVEMMKPPIPI